MSCRNKRLVAAASAAFLAMGSVFAAGDAPTLVTAFSAASPGAALPAPWTRTPIRGVDRATEYALVDDGGTTVLRADAQASAAAVVHKLQAPAPAALLQWRWKVSGVLKSSDPATKEGDDYAARVYVMFDYPLEKLRFGDRMRLRLARVFFDPEVPAAALCYVWDSRLPAGTVLASPYTDRVRIIVVASGAKKAGRWQAVERDVRADFRRAFGEEPPPVSAVAVATDTDNTREKATAWYADIVLKKRAVIAPNG
jgi:hypothetical protein